MAITRAQQAKQLLAQGGRTGFQGGGRDMSTVSAAELGISSDKSKRDYTKQERDQQRETQKLNRRIAENRANRDIETVKNILEKPPIIPGVGGMATKFLGNIFRSKPDKRIEFAKTVSPKFLEYIQGLEEDNLTSRDLMVALDEVRNPLGQTYGDFLLDKYNNPNVKYAGDIGAYNRDMGITGDGPDQPIIPIIPEVASTMDQIDKETLTPVQQALLERGDARRFAAEGGIMDLDAARQELFFGGVADAVGKGLKKVTRGIKKIAQSPIGKAALLYAGTGALGNLAGGSGLGGMFRGIMKPTQFLGGASNIFSREGLRNILVGAPGKYMGPAEKFYMSPATSGILGSGGKLSIGKAITAASLLPLFGLGTGEESEEEAEELLRGQGIDIAAIRANPDQYLARRFAAEGGIMRQQYQEGSKEPVAKKTMPLLDMGGMEKDYREDGGFVPIGRMEKADDVPARLSKNEFVFTADAVRNAGDGDIDKGAEVMYNMMKNLEAGGEVSEESQGLEGAREMFQTSRRLEEVL